MVDVFVPYRPGGGWWFLLSWPEMDVVCGASTFPTLSRDIGASCVADIAQGHNFEVKSALVEQFQVAWGWIE